MSNHIRDDGYAMSDRQVIIDQMEIIVALLRRLEGKVVLETRELNEAHKYTFQVMRRPQEDRTSVELLTLDEGSTKISEAFARRGIHGIIQEINDAEQS